MPGLFIIKKTWLSAFRYAQSRTSLVFCRSLGFPAKSDLADFCALLTIYFFNGHKNVLVGIGSGRIRI